MPFRVSGRTLTGVSAARAALYVLVGIGARALTRGYSVLLSASLLLVPLAALSGCPRRIVVPDAGPEEDAPAPDVPLYRDQDSDGLCDSTEMTLGLDPTRPDTDGDGYLDVLEYSVGTDGRMLDSPAVASLVFLSGTRESTIDTSATFVVRGSGETFIGAFAPVPTFVRSEDLDAFDYFAGARATGATPIENVITFEGERFIGVRNRTLLLYTMTFLNDVESSTCMRIFPFLYQVQTTDDGSIYGQRRMWLVVTPPGMSPGRGAWCPVFTPGVCR